MVFKTELVPWIDEVQSYLRGSTKIGEIKKVLKQADFSKLDYPSQVKLATMFDPACEVTEEVFKRQVDLYFSLLESKKPIKMPVFSSYIDWIYSQDIERLTDVTFDIISSRLLKTSATNLSTPITSFMSRLPYEFERNIDLTTNSRLNTLISILKEAGNEFDKMPNECRDFVKRMYLASAVKTEIAEKNKTRFRGVFKDDPQLYYSLFNKAFAGVGAYDTWIDEPAKKITYTRMIDYSNYQSRVLSSLKSGEPISFLTFESCAKELRLPTFPGIKSVSSPSYEKYYLGESREYKTYAKRLSKMFVGLVRSELSDIEKEYRGKTVPANRLNKFAVTTDMKTRMKNMQGEVVDEEFLSIYANYLINLVHLDELTGQASKDIYSVQRDSDLAMESSQRTLHLNNRVESEIHETESNPRYKARGVSEDHDLSLDLRILNGCCEVDDLPSLYEIYDELLKKGQRNYDIESMIVDLENRVTEEKPDKEENEEENKSSESNEKQK